MIYRVYRTTDQWCVDRADPTGSLEDRSGRWEPVGTHKNVAPNFIGTTVEDAIKALNLSNVPARWEHLYNWDSMMDGCYASV